MQSETGASSSSLFDTHVDQTVEADAWRLFAQAQDLSAFANAWLTILSRSYPDVQESALMLGAPDQGHYEIVARFPRSATSQDDPLPGNCAAVLEASLERRRPAIEDTGHAQLRIGYPLIFSGKLNGVVLVEADARDRSTSRRIMRHLQWSAPGIEAFLGRHDRERGSASAAKAQFLIGAADALAAEDHGIDAARVFANLLTRQFNCDRVAVGRYRGHRSRLVAVAQSVKVDRRDTVSRAIEDAQNEAIDAEIPIVASGNNQVAPGILSANLILSRRLGGAEIVSIPLFRSDRAIGAVTMQRAAPFSEADIDLADVVAAVAGPLLHDKWQQDRWLPMIALDRTTDVIRKLFGPRYFAWKLTTVAILAATAFLTFATDTYRVRARAQIQGETRRLISAPFDGFIRTQYARAGDIVPADFVLAELQDNDLELERLRQIAHKRQHQLELDQALAKRDLAEINIARAQIDQSDAEIDLSQQMIARAKLRAPFAAVVVSGDLSQSVGKPVSRGDTLFELAPLDRYRVTALVPESEIGEIAVGQTGQMLLSALPDRTYPFKIVSVTSVAQAAEGTNGFEVIGTVPAEDQSMRPGMEGVIKIEIERRNLAWIWVHPAIDWLRIKLWGLIP